MEELSVDIAHSYRGSFRLSVDFRTHTAVTSVFGPSGSGKTTLLAILSGMIRPDEARIALGEHVLVDTHEKIFVKPEKRQIGFVFQDHLLFPHLSVEKNLRYGLERRERSPHGITFEKVVEILELGEYLEQSPATLSGGQGQRVALGRALLRGPRLLLLDEPLTALDDALKNRVIEYLERVLSEWRIPTIFVSHNIPEVLRLADEVVVLKSGRVIDQGPAAEVIAHHSMEKALQPNGEREFRIVSG